MIAPSSPTGSAKPLNHYNNKTKFPCLLISTVFVVILALLSVVLFFTLSSKATQHPQASTCPSTSSCPSTTYSVRVPEEEIRLACKAAQHPHSCQSSLIQSKTVPPDPTPLQIIQSAIYLSSQNIKTAESILTTLLNSANGDPNVTNVASICLDVLRYSQHRTLSANESLTRGEIKNSRAWLTAALAYQYDCSGGLRYHAVKNSAEATTFLNRTVEISSNVLSMVVSYDLFGNETASWRPPRSERDGFWEPQDVGGGIEFKGGFPSKLTADVTVCKDGNGGCYKTVQDAVDAAPNNTERRFVIHIKEGVYEGTVRIPFEKKNVVFLGDGMGKTVITGSLAVGQPGVTTYESATVGVLGDGFMASGLTIQNTAGAPTRQAVAFRSDSDLSVVENCEFLGHQDTLYAHSLRQFYKSCRIEGNVDFIFGNSAAVFQDCEILVRSRQEEPEKGETNAITAHGRTDPAQSTGFVFQNCLVNGTEEYMQLYLSKPSVHHNFLGRPWKEYSRTAFIHCNLEALVSPDGWMPWSGDFALETLYYGEFENSGPGSDVSKRVNWSSQIPAQYTYTYSVQNFIQGDEWIPTSS